MRTLVQTRVAKAMLAVLQVVMALVKVLALSALVLVPVVQVLVLMLVRECTFVLY